MEHFHSVTLDESRCKGCFTCVKRCPTEAIRVRDGKASIIKERCIDCGECIRVCPHHAKKAVFTPLEEIENFRWKVALPAPSLYGQFNNLDDIDFVLTGLLHIGFDDVFEVSAAAEIISDLTRQYMAKPDIPKPVLSTACPAVVRLVQARFPELTANLLPLIAPVELAAIMARRQAVKKTGFKPEEIGIFFISPCPAKITAFKNPIVLDSPVMDGALSMTDVYIRLVGQMNKIGMPSPLSNTGILGVSWASGGGESAALLKEKYLAADGIEQVIKVLEELENDKLSSLDFIELNACTGGCVGGCLTVENPFVAKARLQRLRKYLPVSMNRAQNLPQGVSAGIAHPVANRIPSMTLASDVEHSMEIMRQIEEIRQGLPGLDCGSCGAPSCLSLAEDIVRGTAEKKDCVFILKQLYLDREKADEEAKHHDS